MSGTSVMISAEAKHLSVMLIAAKDAATRHCTGYETESLPGRGSSKGSAQLCHLLLQSIQRHDAD